MDRMASAAEDAERLTTRTQFLQIERTRCSNESVAEAQKESAMTGFGKATAEEVERAAEEAMQRRSSGAIADATVNGEDAAAAEAAFNCGTEGA